MPDLMLIVKILALALVICGTIIVYLAPTLVKKYNLDNKAQLTPAQMAELDPQQQADARMKSAILTVKLKGLLLSLPGYIVILIYFR